MTNLYERLEEWQELFIKYGEDLGPQVAQVMLIRILPSVLKTEIQRRPELKNLELMKLLDWVRHQTLQERNEMLADQMLKPDKVIHQLQRQQRKQQPAPEPAGDVEPPPVAALTGQDRRPPRRPQQGAERTPGVLMKLWPGDCYPWKGRPQQIRIPRPRILRGIC